MAEPTASGMTLRLELFVNELAASRDFYGRVLGFTIGAAEPGGYTPTTNGQAQIALNVRSHAPDHHPSQAPANDRPSRGVEIVLEVDDVAAIHARVVATGWPLSSPLTTHSWGQTDLCVDDPDGNRVRVTSRR